MSVGEKQVAQATRGLMVGLKLAVGRWLLLQHQ